MEFTGVPVNFSDSPIPGPVMPVESSMIGSQFSENMYQSEHNSAGDVQYTETHSTLADGGHQFGVSTLCFDALQELLWMGNQGGHVTSYYGPAVEKYTSFQVHSTDEIRQILTIDNGCLFLTRNNLRCSIRRGLKQFDYNDEYMEDMQCMIMTSPESVLMGGHQTKVIELDLNKLQQIRQVDVSEPGCAIFRASNKFICAGDTSGKITLYDHSTLNAEHVVPAHTGTLSDFDIDGNLLVTCGYSNRMGNLAPDRYLMVYDLRFIRAMAPIKVVVDPTFLRFLPAYTNKLCVVSQVGHFQVLDTTSVTPSSMMLYQVNTQGGVVLSFDISSNCQNMAFGDSSGYIHLFAATEQAPFNAYPQPTEFSDPVEPFNPMHINDELSPFAIIPMTYPSEGTLFSDWPARLCRKVYRTPKPVEPELLRTMKMRHNVGYAPNPGTTRRNQVPYDLKAENNNKKSHIPESSTGRDDALVNIPKIYRKVEMKYSKLGYEDFEFRYYNKTHFAGLETQTPNAYCNGMLQVLYFIEPLRCAMKSHLCEREFCLACELGFLIHMLDEQKGQTCQANNFLRAFRTIPEAAALGLILGDHDQLQGKINLTRLIQNWQRFLHQQVHSETCIREPIYVDVVPEEASVVDGGQEDGYFTAPGYEESALEGQGDQLESGESSTEKPATESVLQQNEREISIISRLFGTQIETVLRCRCGHKTRRETHSTLTNLSYPIPAADASPVPITFSQVLHHSLTSEQVIQAWCNDCSRYQPHVQKKLVKSLPDILALNCGLENPRDIEFWRTQLQFIKKEPPEQQEDVNSPRKKLCRYGKLCKRQDCFFLHKSEKNVPNSEIPAEVFDPVDDGLPTSYVPIGLHLSLAGDEINITQSFEESESCTEDELTKEYEIFATVAHVKDPKTAGNLVSSIQVGKTYHQRKEKVTHVQWYLFNDFSITPIEMSEALQFDMDWKVPCIIYFARKNINSFYDLSLENPITSKVLFDESGIVNPKRTEPTFVPLSPEELPEKGSLVALDAEFVSLDQEQAELKSDGTRSTLKPSHLALARLTCLRGYGPIRGEPFIDDYIAMQEQVVDYLTEYSGIKPDDLIASVSTKHLTTLKSTYMKLRYLVDLGVIFIGHGLKKDFRVINISVPKNQVIDTVDLLHLPRQRNISLKFLARYFLKIDIQSYTHDSIEDARSALRLYCHYQELSKNGEEHVKNVIKDLYEFGRKVTWKLPFPEDLPEPT